MGFFDDLISRVKTFQTECPLAFAFPRTALAICTPENIQNAQADVFVDRFVKEMKKGASMLPPPLPPDRLPKFMLLNLGGSQLRGFLHEVGNFALLLPQEKAALDLLIEVGEGVAGVMQASASLVGPVLSAAAKGSEIKRDEQLLDSMTTLLQLNIADRLVEKIENDILKECEAPKTDDQEMDCLSYRWLIELNRTTRKLSAY